MQEHPEEYEDEALSGPMKKAANLKYRDIIHETI
jgi:hypothetical protein